MTISDHCFFETFLAGSCLVSLIVAPYLLNFGWAGLGFEVDLDYLSLFVQSVQLACDFHSSIDQFLNRLLSFFILTNQMVQKFVVFKCNPG